MGFGRGTHIDCEDCHFSGYFLGSYCVDVSADITLHRCTVQVWSGLLCVPVIHGGARTATVPQQGSLPLFSNTSLLVGQTL
jgi:hypothetical protein